MKRFFSLVLMIVCALFIVVNLALATESLLITGYKSTLLYVHLGLAVVLGWCVCVIDEESRKPVAQ